MKLTPNIKRLLTLLQSDDSIIATQAVHQLGLLKVDDITLWMILVECINLCQDSRWLTREYAAKAIEQISQNIPQVQTHHFITQKINQQTSHHYLTLDNIQKEMPQIIKAGVELYAQSPDSKIYDVMESSSSEDRIRDQRDILARKIGLGSKIYGGLSETTECINDILKQTQAGDGEIHSSIGGMKRSSVDEKLERYKHKKRKLLADKNGTLQVLQSLVLAELSRERVHSSSCGSDKAEDDAHATKNLATVQHLFTTELIFTSFDSLWFKRHGALLAVFHLLKGFDVMKWCREKKRLGTVVEDIACRCICLLLLDKFHDYSAYDNILFSSYDNQEKEEKSGKAFYHGIATAPVREMAGRCLAFIYNLAEEENQRIIRSFLMESLSPSKQRPNQDLSHPLMENDECVFGLLVGVKYILLSSNDQKSEVDLLCHYLHATYDDVSNLAAQILSTIPKDIPRSKANSILQTLWDKIETLSEVGSGADWVNLAYRLVSLHGTSYLHERYFQLCFKLISYPSIGIKVTALAILQELIHSFKPSNDKKLNNTIHEVIETLFAHATKHYRLMGHHEYDKLLEKTWSSIVDQFVTIFRSSEACSHQESVIPSLVSVYLNSNQQTVEDKSVSYSPSNYQSKSSLKLMIDLIVSSIRINEGAMEVWKEAVMFMLETHLIRRGLDILYCYFQLPEAIETDNKSLNSQLASRLFGLLNGSPLHVNNQLEADSILKFEVAAKQGFTKLYRSKVLLEAAMKGPSWDSIKLQCLLSSTLIQYLYSVMVLTPDRPCVNELLQTINKIGTFKWTPLIRPIMTFLKNSATGEEASVSDELTCKISESLYKMLIILKHADQAIYKRLLKNVLNFNVKAGLWKFLPLEDVYDFSKLTTFGENDNVKCNGELNLLVDFTRSMSMHRLSLSAPALESNFISLSSCLNLILQISCSTTEKDEQRKASSTLILIIIHVGCSIFQTSSKFIRDKHIQNMKDTLSSLLSYLKSNTLVIQSTAATLLVTLLEKIKSMNPSKEEMSLILKFVPRLLLQSLRMISKVASASDLFRLLIRLSPLVSQSSFSISDKTSSADDDDMTWIEHLIYGNRLPIPRIPYFRSKGASIMTLKTKLRDYQIDGVAFLHFIYKLGLSGILADEMGLGKTITVLTLIAVLVNDQILSVPDVTSSCFALILCPSTLVDHWAKEFDNHFEINGFTVTKLISSRSKIDNLSKPHAIIMSYDTLSKLSQANVTKLAMIRPRLLVCDEAHIMRNVKSQRFRKVRALESSALSKIFLTGTPIMNNIHDLYNLFSLMLPHYLPAKPTFNATFAKIIQKGLLGEGSAEDTLASMKKLKELHQLCLPFILRREKSKVLHELPPKIITVLECDLPEKQRALYQSYVEKFIPNDLTGEINLQKLLVQQKTQQKSSTLKHLLNLRYLCTHPILLDENYLNKVAPDETESIFRTDISAKLMLLNELLRSLNIYAGEVNALDEDEFFNTEQNVMVDDLVGDGFDDLLMTTTATNASKGSTVQEEIDMHHQKISKDTESSSPRDKCLIFAQFTKSLQLVEDLLFKLHMPNLQFLRLDGTVPASKRSAVVNEFQTNPDVKVLLLTTKIGGLGLTLTAADTVIFLEIDWNPQVDIQAMDRTHRIGQKSTVRIYQLITKDTIEEKMINLQKAKLKICDKIVNTDNSSVYSMGTDRILDLVSGADVSAAVNDGEQEDNIYDLAWGQIEEEYQSLSIESFLTIMK